MNCPVDVDDDAAMETALERNAAPRSRSVLEAERERVTKGHEPDTALRKWGPLLEEEFEEILANERQS
jgi:hypothetical protein